MRTAASSLPWYIIFISGAVLTVALVAAQKILTQPSTITLVHDAEHDKVFGYSTLGKPIEGYELGTGAETLFFFGAIHGNEKGTAVLMEELAATLIADPSLIPDHKKVVIIPNTNPDGFYGRDDKLNSNGVNLNRNFPTTDWIEYDDKDDPETYAGPEPFSESESRLIKDVVENIEPSVMIAFHSMGALVSPEFNDASIELSEWYSAHTGYEYYDEWDYAGTATRWFVETTGKPATTVELTNHRESDWDINKPALLELIAR